MHSLQQDLRNLQEKVTEKGNEITAIVNDFQCNQDRIEALELEKNEMATQMESLEARCREVEFFRDTYSWEVDQLRDDLMDKEVEIDFLRKEQVYMTPISTQPPPLQLVSSCFFFYNFNSQCTKVINGQNILSYPFYTVVAFGCLFFYNTTNTILPYLMHTSLTVHALFLLQYPSVERRSLHRQHSLLHKNHRTSSLRAMASSFMLWKAVYQQKYHKQSWMCKLVCLVSFRCLLTVSYSVRSSGCTVTTSSQSPSLLRYSTVLYSPVMNSVCSSALFLPNAPTKNYPMCSKCETEISSVPTVHMVAYH